MLLSDCCFEHLLDVPLDVAPDLLHVLVVILSVLVLRLPKDLNDVPASSAILPWLH